MKKGQKKFFVLFIENFLKNQYYFIRFSVKILMAYIFNININPVQYFVVNKNKIVYINNAKAACSSIKRALISSDSNSELIESHYSEIHKKAIVNGYQKGKLTKKEKEYYFFSFVRNPFARIVSLYVNKFEDQFKIAQGGYFQYQKYLGGTIKQSFTFEKFVNVISTIPDKYSESHFMSQSYLLSLSPKKLDFIGKLENFSNDFSSLCNNIDIENNVSFSNQSKKYNYMDYYNSETLDLIYKRYKKDVIEFNYEEEYKLLKEYIVNNTKII